MITVPEATKTIIERSRYLSEAISKGLINYSSLARYIKPELEQMLLKKVSTASIVMALNRLESDFAPKYKRQNIFHQAPEIVVRSNLSLYALPNVEFAGLALLLSRETTTRSFYLKSQGLHETSIVLSSDLLEKYKMNIESKNPIFNKKNVAAVTVYLPIDAINTPGIYYFFLKSLAWEGINLLEIVSTAQELTLIVDSENAERTSSIIKTLFADISNI